jgi:hypothetical protein
MRVRRAPTLFVVLGVLVLAAIASTLFGLNVAGALGLGIAVLTIAWATTLTLIVRSI